MAIHLNQNGMDALLDYIAGSTQMDCVSDTGQPSDLSNSIAEVSMSSSDFTKSDSGDDRVLDVAAKDEVDVTADGTSRHVVLSESGTIRVVTECGERSWVSGDKMNFPSWSYTLEAPTAAS